MLSVINNRNRHHSIITFSSFFIATEPITATPCHNWQSSPYTQSRQLSIFCYCNFPFTAATTIFFCCRQCTAFVALSLSKTMHLLSHDDDVVVCWIVEYGMNEIMKYLWHSVAWSREFCEVMSVGRGKKLYRKTLWMEGLFVWVIAVNGDSVQFNEQNFELG